MRLTDTSRGRVVRMLERAGIARRQVGGQRLVFAADIKTRMPVLWHSLVACEQAREVTRSIARLDCAQTD